MKFKISEQTQGINLLMEQLLESNISIDVGDRWLVRNEQGFAVFSRPRRSRKTQTIYEGESLYFACMYLCKLYPQDKD